MLKLQTTFCLIFLTGLCACIHSLPTGQDQLEIDILGAESEFFNSLTPQQRSRWTKIRDKVLRPALGAAVGVATGGIINPTIGGVIGAAIGKKRDATDDLEELVIFLNSLSPQQRGLWTKIRDKVVNPALSTIAVNAIVGAAIGRK